jgi:hypothetical protein
MITKGFAPVSAQTGVAAPVGAFSPEETSLANASIYKNPADVAAQASIPQVQVIAPDGSIGSIPITNLEQAKALGYKEPTAQDIAVKQYLKENEGLAEDRRHLGVDAFHGSRLDFALKERGEFERSRDFLATVGCE